MLLTIFFASFFLSFVLNSGAARADIETQTYVVHMDKVKMRKLDASLGVSRSWHKEVIESIRTSSSDDEQPYLKLHYVYEQTMFGFSAKLTNQHLQTLQSVDGFLLATKDKLRNLHTTHSPQFLGLEARESLWSPENLESDVIIGVIDTGIWPEHSSFHEKGLSEVPSRWKGTCKNYTNFNASSCNRKLIGAAVFYEGYKSMDETKNDTSEYTSPRDSEGHGTHTASTAGGNFVSNANILGMANGTAVGMRPTARIAAYKCCFSSGCSDSDMLAAIEQAVKDGVDVLSISLGGDPAEYHNDSLAIGTFGAVRKGIIVSLSAGNSGPNSYTVENAAPWMMTVAASSIDRDFLANVHLGDGTNYSGSSLSSAKLPKNLTLIYDESETIGANLCLKNSLSSGRVNGKIVICDRGNNSRVEKGEEVLRVGGVGMILANVNDNGEETIADPHVLPAIQLGASAANAIRNYMKSSNNPTATMEFKGTTYKNRAPIMAAFSSRGPNKVDPLILKPDITAPGVNILAAYPPHFSLTNLESDDRHGPFNMMSGTSMSCPHVSGILALVRSAHKDWSPAAIKSALMTTAYILDSENSPISDMSDKSPATPYALGSGHVDVNKASDPGLIYDISTQDYLHYLCNRDYNSTQMALFSGVCHAGSHFRPEDLNYPSFSVVFDTKFIVNRSTTTYKRTVTNVGSSEVITYKVKVSEPEGVSITVKPKVLKFTTNKNKLSYCVTFTASGKRSVSSNFSFGSLKWISGEYSVRSSIAILWN